MDPVTARDRIAAYCAGVAGILEAQAGYQALPPKYPGIAVILGNITLDYMSTEQYWAPLEVRGLLMTGLVNDTDRHVAQIDPLLAPLVDMFSAGTNGAILAGSDGDRADNCLIRTIEPSQEIGYAGHVHYGAVLTWQVFFPEVQRLMSDEDNIVYRYEAHFDGEFFQGIPARDLTQADVDRMDPVQKREAFASHPLYGTPLYVAVGAEPTPKWWTDKVADAAGAAIEPRLEGETKRQYEDRIAAEATVAEPAPVRDEPEATA